MSTRCIICYTDLPQWSPKKPPDILTKSSSSASPEQIVETELQGQVQQKDLLSKHLDVIFILRNIFEVPLTQLSFYLRHCPSIENWITTCGKCEELVENYGVIYRKWQEAKSRLIKTVKENYDKDRDKDVGMVALDITDKCRQFISEYNYKVVTNHFIEGDLRARRKLLKLSEEGGHDENLEEIEVKEELPELLHFPESHLDYLNGSLLVEAANIPTVNDSSPLNLNPYHDEDSDHWNEDIEMDDGNEDLSQQQPDAQTTLITELPQHPISIIPSKQIRSNTPRVAKQIAKTKTQNLLLKPDKSLIPPKPKREKKGKDHSKKYFLSSDEPKRKIGRPRKYFYPDNLQLKIPCPTIAFSPDDPKRKRGRPRKYFYPNAPISETEKPSKKRKTIKYKTFQNKKGKKYRRKRESEPVPEPEPEPADQEESQPEPPPPPPSPKVIFKDDSEDEDIPVNEYNDDDFEISDIDAAEESSDFQLSENEEKRKKYKKRKSNADKSRWKLKCPETDCPSEFDRRLELNAHLLEIHDKLPQPPVIGQRKYPDECYEYCENRKRQYHLKIASKCDLCLKTFTSQGGLRAHMRLMDELRWPHHCKICGKGDTSKASLEKHEALCETGEALLTLVTCPVEGCGLILNTTVVLETHYRHHHREMEQQPCTIQNCPEKFFTETGLEIHLKDKHKEDKPFQCDHCNQGFSSKTKMEEHKKRVVAREAVEKDPSLAKICNYCGKSFITEAGLRYHVDSMHEKKFKYTCEHCGKGNSCRDKMNIHLWKVHKRRDVSLRWRCEVEGCGRICTTGKQFEAHKARHAGTPQFCCEECGKEFYEVHHLKEHVEAMHESKKKGEKVKCEICGMEFGYWKYKERHRRTVHEMKKRRPKNKPKSETEPSEMKEEQKVMMGTGNEEVFMAAGQQFNLQIL